MKEKTIEEAARSYINSNFKFVLDLDKKNLTYIREVFEAGANQQKEQDISTIQGYLSANLKNIELMNTMYTEEEILKFVKESNGDLNNANTWINWFENNKKK